MSLNLKKKKKKKKNFKNFKLKNMKKNYINLLTNKQNQVTKLHLQIVYLTKKIKTTYVT